MKMIVVVADAAPLEPLDANACAKAHRVPEPFPGMAGVLCMGCVWNDTDGRIYVLLSRRASVNDIAHEAAHAAQLVVDAAVLPRRRARQANEQYTYLVGWIAQRLYDTVKGRHSPADAAAQRSAARL